MTGKLGCLHPVMLIEVNSGDSIQIDASMLFNFFPFVFPVQTPIRASVYFFYGRNRIFWDNWQDFAYNNKQPDHPFILQPNGPFWSTGSLVDFLGVPTTYTNLGVTQNILNDNVKGSWPGYPNKSFSSFGGYSNYIYTVVEFMNSLDPFDFKFIYSSSSSLVFINFGIRFNKDNYHQVIDFLNPVELNQGQEDSMTLSRFVVYAGINDVLDQFICMCSSTTCPQPTTHKFTFDANFHVKTFVGGVDIQNGIEYLNSLFQSYPNAELFLVLCLQRGYAETLYPELADPDKPYVFTENSFFYGVSINQGLSETVDLSVLGSNPFSGTISSPPRIPLSAIPFRFYEAVYNCYFRNEKNDPFYVDGEIEYNKYNTTRADGADSTPYKLYYRNWEADFLTTATQTPQQGLAPLVGINVRGDMEFLNEDGTITKIRPTIADDGHTITGISGIVENGTPEALKSAMDYITAGISINDFRQVNSLQRWLEDNLRRGLKYRDQVLASTGVKIRYDELDMPEFIGGFSQPVQVTQITQATPSTADDNALGSRAGQASVFGGSKHKISHYCDEAGFIMAILCVYPQPVYTQLLPKYFLKKDALSYYHPQFGQIGMQPISYKEVCPIQVFQQSGDLDATFGYQRPWYDLIRGYDEAHGQMRTTMRDFLMHRTFAGIPKLGQDFLHIDPKQLNDVFAYRGSDGDEDVFQGQLYFEIFAKRAIPRFGIPRIE